MTSEPTERELLGYEGFGEAIRQLAHEVADSGYDPDWIVCIARGGLIVGGALGYALGVKNIATLNVEFYTGIDERLPVPVVLPPALDMSVISTQRILVVDDVADTGETLALVVKECIPYVAEVRSAVLYGKSRSVIEPEFVWRRTDGWIEFPWSSQPAITGRGVADA